MALKTSCSPFADVHSGQNGRERDEDLLREIVRVRVLVLVLVLVNARVLKADGLRSTGRAMRNAIAKRWGTFFLCDDAQCKVGCAQSGNGCVPMQCGMHQTHDTHAHAHLGVNTLRCRTIYTRAFPVTMASPSQRCTSRRALDADTSADSARASTAGRSLASALRPACGLSNCLSGSCNSAYTTLHASAGITTVRVSSSAADAHLQRARAIPRSFSSAAVSGVSYAERLSDAYVTIEGGYITVRDATTDGVQYRHGARLHFEARDVSAAYVQSCCERAFFTVAVAGYDGIFTCTFAYPRNNNGTLHEQLAPLPASEMHACVAVAQSDDARLLAGGTLDGRLAVWNLPSVSAHVFDAHPVHALDDRITHLRFSALSSAAFSRSTHANAASSVRYLAVCWWSGIVELYKCSVDEHIQVCLHNRILHAHKQCLQSAMYSAGTFAAFHRDSHVLAFNTFSSTLAFACVHTGVVLKEHFLTESPCSSEKTCCHHPPLHHVKGLAPTSHAVVLWLRHCATLRIFNWPVCHNSAHESLAQPSFTNPSTTPHTPPPSARANAPPKAALPLYDVCGITLFHRSGSGRIERRIMDARARSKIALPFNARTLHIHSTSHSARPLSTDKSTMYAQDVFATCHALAIVIGKVLLIHTSSLADWLAILCNNTVEKGALSTNALQPSACFLLAITTNATACRWQVPSLTAIDVSPLELPGPSISALGCLHGTGAFVVVGRAKAKRRGAAHASSSSLYLAILLPIQGEHQQIVRLLHMAAARLQTEHVLRAFWNLQSCFVVVLDHASSGLTALCYDAMSLALREEVRISPPETKLPFANLIALNDIPVRFSR